MLGMAIQPLQAASARPVDEALLVYESGHYEESYSQFLALSRQGDALAMYNAGIQLLNGQGVHPDPERAAYWIGKAARLGNAKAQSLYGTLYLSGFGVRKDELQAYEWYTKAAAQGEESAIANLKKVTSQSECPLGRSKIFDVVLRCATRPVMRKAIHEAGVHVLREDDSLYFDLYDAKWFDPLADRVAMGYLDNQLGIIQIRFPERKKNDDGLLRDVLSVFEKKYGPPLNPLRHDRVLYGQVNLIWKMVDNMEVHVVRRWPIREVTAMFIVPGKGNALNARLKQSPM